MLLNENFVLFDLFPMNPIQKFWWYFRGFILFVLYVLLNILLVAFTLPFLFCSQNTRAKIISKALRLVLWIVFDKGISSFGGYNISVKGKKNICESGAIYVCNHASLFDPFWAMTYIPNAGVLIKSKYAKIMAIWYLVKVFDFIAIDSLSPSALAPVVEQAQRSLANGRNLLIFPEGTRTMTGRLGDFKSLAFKLSKKTGAPIVPMTICSDVPFFAKFQKTIIPEEFANLTVEFLPALKPNDFRDDKAMLASTHRIISKNLRGRLFEKTCNNLEK